MSDDKPTVIRRRKKLPEVKAPEKKSFLETPMGEPQPPRPPVGARDKYRDHEAMRDTSLSGRPVAQPKPRPKGVVPPRRNYKLVDNIDPLELFAGYHLGLTADQGYRPQNVHDLGRRFRTSPARINEALKIYEIDSETVMNTDYDITMAEYDIRVAPPGISRRELARQLYEDFRDSPRIPRNWRDEIAEDAAQNDFIFRKLK
jgi:hypothetical protein